MGLNRKGYMLVEIVVASVLAMGIAYYLLNLTYRFKDLDEDIYQSYLYTQNKNLIVKNVMNDLEGKTIKKIGSKKQSDDNSYSYVDFKLNNDEYRRVKLEKKGDDKWTFYYGKIDIAEGIEINNISANEDYKSEDLSYYERTFEQILSVGEMEFEPFDEIVTFKIPISSVYDDKDYSIKFFGRIKKVSDGTIESDEIIDTGDTTE